MLAASRLVPCVIGLLVAAACEKPPTVTPLPVEMRVLPGGLPIKELVGFALRHTPPQPERNAKSAEQWSAEAKKLRRRLLDEVFFDEAIRGLVGRAAPLEVGVVQGEGFRIRKLKVEILQGLYGPMLVYEPTATDSVPRPVVISFTGHASGGDVTAPDHQSRAIHLARQGCIVVSVEWFGNGELGGLENDHAAINLLDLVGVHGVGVHYALIRRALDVALGQPRADSSRVAAIGLSGGGWLALIAGALDERITLVNSVSGFGAYEKRAVRIADLGDSEQSAADLYRIADYTTLAALIAPRPLLLTYNEPDSCCFRASVHVPVLEQSLAPVWKLFGADERLRFHTSTVPGTHNFEADNREALYRFLVDTGFTSSSSFSLEEGDLAAVTPSPDALRVGLADNKTLRSVVDGITEKYQRGAIPESARELEAWRSRKRAALKELLNVARPRAAAVVPRRRRSTDTAQAVLYRVGDTWTLPAVAHRPKGTSTGTTIILANSRDAPCVGIEAARAVMRGERALALDVLHTGELHLRYGDALYSMIFGATDRPSLGIQVNQLLSVARAVRGEGARPVRVTSCSMRMTLVALSAAALDDHDDIGDLTLYEPRTTLLGPAAYHKRPEMFPFGILTVADYPELFLLAAPRHMTVYTRRPKAFAAMVDQLEDAGVALEIHARPRIIVQNDDDDQDDAPTSAR